MATFSENRGIARTYLSSFMDQGFSANQVLRTLADQGLGYRRTDFLSDWREFQGLEKKKDVFRYIRKDYKPTSATITETNESLSKEYSYIFELKGRDRLTGETVTQGWRHATDSLLTLEESEELVNEMMGIPKYDTGIDDVTVSVIGVKRSVTL